MLNNHVKMNSHRLRCVIAYTRIAENADGIFSAGTTWKHQSGHDSLAALVRLEKSVIVMEQAMAKHLESGIR